MSVTVTEAGEILVGDQVVGMLEQGTARGRPQWGVFKVVREGTIIGYVRHGMGGRWKVGYGRAMYRTRENAIAAILKRKGLI